MSRPIQCTQFIGQFEFAAAHIVASMPIVVYEPLPITRLPALSEKCTRAESGLQLTKSTISTL